MTHVFHPAMTRLSDESAVSPKRQATAPDNRGEAFRETLARHAPAEENSQDAQDDAASTVPSQSGKNSKDAPPEDAIGIAHRPGQQAEKADTGKLTSEATAAAAQTGSPADTPPTDEAQLKSAHSETRSPLRTDPQTIATSPEARTDASNSGSEASTKQTNALTVSTEETTAAKLTRAHAEAPAASNALQAAAYRDTQAASESIASAKTIASDMETAALQQAKEAEAASEKSRNVAALSEQAGDKTITQANVRPGDGADLKTDKQAHSGTPAAPADSKDLNVGPRAAPVSDGEIRQVPSLNDNSRTGAGTSPESLLREGSARAETDIEVKADRTKASRISDISHPVPPAETDFVSKSSDPVTFMSASSSDTAVLSLTDGSGNLLTGSAATSSSAQLTPMQMASSHIAAAMRSQAAMVAAPAELVDIVQNKLADGGKPDRVTVQLDPPELGRVSIDFKFDAQGLQHITVTGETPEAMKQLRQLHYQLTQALEQHGLSGQDMTFQQQFAQQGEGQGDQNPLPFSTHQDAGESENTAQPAIPAIMARQNLRTLSAGLNIKL